ncbi:MAG: hypothetical protein IIV89_03760 [Bacteroidaceae bacterium]|nr:hypothetical protein [Bacteroidaceae bacterium]
MKSTRTFAICLAAMLGLTLMNSGAQAQTKIVTPQRVETAVKVHQSAEWYKTQERLWRTEIEKNRKNEEAWGNYYRAVKYRSWSEAIPDIDERLDTIVEEMEKAIPDTYTYYITRFHNNNQAKDNPGMAKAIKMRPDAVDDYPTFISYLMQTGDEETMRDILTRWYNSGSYSPTLLNYAYNELIGLAPNAIIFAHGDTQTFSKLILQYGKGIRPDVTIINTTFWLFTADYRSLIEKKLNLPSFAQMIDNGTYKLDNKDLQKVKDLVYQHLVENTELPIYFSPMMETEMPNCADKLYSEGLVMRYSKKPYDNLTIKRRNYEELYLTDYLRESFLPESYPAAIDRYNFNYIPCFKSLLNHYKHSGNTERYQELRNLMMRIVEHINVPAEEKKRYYEEINR